MQNLSDMELMQLVMVKHRPALEQIYDRYVKLVYSFAFKSTQNEWSSREIVQLVFTRLWTTESSYDEAKGQFVNWLLTITRNITIDQIRKEKKHDAPKLMLMEQWEQIPDASLATIEQLAAKEDLTQQIQYAFRFLNNNQVQLIEHLYWHGYTLSEIAQKFNEPLGTIKSRLHQSLKILRKHLQKREG